MPEQLLLRDRFRDPAKGAGLGASHPAVGARHLRPLPALALRVGDHLLEAMDETAEKARSRLRDTVVRLIGHFTVRLVTLRADRHEKNVHRRGLTIPRLRPFAVSEVVSASPTTSSDHP